MIEQIANSNKIKFVSLNFFIFLLRMIMNKFHIGLWWWLGSNNVGFEGTVVYS